MTWATQMSCCKQYKGLMKEAANVRDKLKTELMNALGGNA